MNASNRENLVTCPVTVKTSATGDNATVVTLGQMQDGKFVAFTHDDTNNVVFVGVSEGNAVINRMIGIDYAEVVELFTRAVNNRTRQRNYFRLYNQMLLNEISEEDFYATIENDEDDYVIEELETPSKERLLHALKLSKNIKDVNNSEDFSNLFSFDSVETDKQLANIKEDACIQ